MLYARGNPKSTTGLNVNKSIWQLDFNNPNQYELCKVISDIASEAESRYKE